MGYRNGRLYSCDRCGATVFCPCTGEEEAGFARWNTFVQLPSWWADHHVGLLCPKCSGEYGEWIERFMGGEADDV